MVGSIEKDNNILLTIAIPTYNRAKFLSRAISSVLIQQDRRVELLISDNASTDETQQIVERLLHEGHPITYLRNRENIGPDKNFLQCYTKARGKFVLLIGDDDLIIENSLSYLLSFLQGDGADAKLIFVNHALFQNEYIDLSHCYKVFLDNIPSVITQDKKKFIALTSHRITYVGALLLRKDLILQVEDPEQYNQTYFMHTCIALNVTKDPDAILGVVGKPCVAQDATFGNATFDLKLWKTFEAFGKGMEYVFCELAPQCGYDKKQMVKIYETWIAKGWPGTIFRLKWERDKHWKAAFRQYGKPVLKKHRKVWRKVMPYVWCPNWLARCIYGIYQKKKVK